MITSLRRRRRELPLLLSLALGLLALLLAGCSSGSVHGGVLARPSSSLRVSPTASATPTPAPSPSSAAGVEAGVRAWVDAANKAFATGDTTDLRTRTGPGCSCAKLVKTVRGYWSHGSIQGLTWTLHRVHVITVGRGLSAVDFDFDETPYRVVADGQLSPATKATRVSVFSEFQLVGGQWLLAVYNQTDKRAL